MQYTRKNVWELGGPWADPILWYARAIAVMKARALNQPTGWRFYAAIHGFDTGLWTKTGNLVPSDPNPNQADRDRFWEQCQHGSWYFLPWHRGYLLAFEANIRAAIKSLGGPDWALPYWNYFKSGEGQLPPAFASADWPDGKGDNPLFVTQRYGPDNSGNVYVPLDQVNLDAMNDSDFTGVVNGDRGFGGIDTGFEHGGPYHGQLEQQPHDQVHGLVGGGTSQNPGLMSYPETAGLDPIFWLHHANIDRLWQIWRQNPQTHTDPIGDLNWVKGPANVGARIFSMPMPDGTAWDYMPGDMEDPGKLGYTYDDLSPAVAPTPPAQRLLTLGASAAAVSAMRGVVTMASGKNVELVGANRESLKIEGAEARTSVQLDPGVRRKVSASLALAAEPAAPDRVFLNLENVRGLGDGTVFQVYVGLPEDADPAHYPERRAGSISLFGVSKATNPDGEHAGQGLSFSLEITKMIDALHLTNALEIDSLGVRIVPRRPVPAEEQISIGRVSIFRQGL